MDLANHQYHNAFLNTSVKTNKHVRQFRELKHDSEGGCVSHQEDRRPLSDRDAPAETAANQAFMPANAGTWTAPDFFANILPANCDPRLRTQTTPY